jgi:hypothetical protein
MGSDHGRTRSGGHLIVRRTLLLCALVAVAASPVRSAGKVEKPVDDDLLEFLGSLDSEEEGWHDYLEQVPVKKPPPAPADAKQVKSK